MNLSNNYDLEKGKSTNIVLIEVKLILSILDILKN